MHRFTLVPAAYLLLVRGYDDGLEVLLQLRGPGSSWLPGHWASGAAGHVEAGESVHAAICREAGEELGIEVLPVDLEPLCTMHRTMPGVSDAVEQRVDWFFLARTWRGEPAIQEPAKCAELRWARPGDLPQPIVPHEAELLGRLGGGDGVPPIMSFGFGDR